MTILATLITPLVLASTPATINVQVPEYNHATQGSELVAQYQTSQITWHGTQTYDYNGKPRDADNDKERD